MTAILSSWPITLGKTDLDNVSLSDMWKLRVFVYTSVVDDKHPLPNCDDFRLPIQMEFSNKKHLLNFLFHFLNLQKKMIVIANIFPNLQTVKDFVRSLSKKRCFRTHFDSQDVKGFQTLAKSSWEPFCHIFLSLWGKLIGNISLLVICEIGGFCWHIDTELWEFADPSS